MIILASNATTNKDPRMTELISSLMELGLNEIEAKVYLYLASNPSSTGYKIAQGINKPAANTYKSIDLLLGKGLLILDKGSVKRYSAITQNELLSRYKKKYAQNLENIKKLFADVPVKKPNIALFNLNTVEQIDEKFISMVNSAKYSIFLDIYPSFDEKYLSIIQDAIDREVSVLIKSYNYFNIQNAECIIDHRGEDILFGGNKKRFHLIVDNRRLLATASNKNDIEYALWTENHHLVILLAYGFILEVTIDKAIIAEKEGINSNILEMINYYRKNIFNNF